MTKNTHRDWASGCLGGKSLSGFIKISGEISIDLFTLPQIKDINIINNNFVGSLASNLHCSATLGQPHYYIELVRG